WNGADNTSGYLVLMYGGSTTPRTVTVAHPLIALASDLFSYTAPGALIQQYDRFGRSTSNTYDANGLYLTQTVLVASPSPSQTTNYTYNSLGQLILTTDVSGAQSVAEQTWRDSWGRIVGVVSNCTPAVAPPNRCTGAPNPATNVMIR